MSNMSKKINFNNLEQMAKKNAEAANKRMKEQERIDREERAKRSRKNEHKDMFRAALAYLIYQDIVNTIDKK